MISGAGVAAALRHICPSRLAVAAVVLVIMMLEAIPAARADAAAGSAAFERGDYVRAMAEWANAAERGDADAEFGLGMLYELGAGELTQDYKQADRWYQRAAEHNNIGAEYRLALIWSAGGDDFPPDLAEAYKWIVLAADKGLATDVKAQLEKVIDRGQQAEALKRVAAWKEARAAARKAEPAVAVAPAPSSGGAAPAPMPPPRSSGPAPSGTASSGSKAGGCPGWPFPTLPCTEQFPALGGAPAQRTPALPPPRPAAPRPPASN